MSKQLVLEAREDRKVLEDIATNRAKQHNSPNAKHIREAISEGLEGAAKINNAQARITVALINAFRSGEEKASDADDYMHRDPSDEQKKAGKRYLRAMCGTYSQAYTDAETALAKLREEKSGKENDKIAIDKHENTIAAVQQMLYRCIVAAYFAHHDCHLVSDAKYNPKDGSLRLEGHFDGPEADSDVMRLSVSRLFDMAAKMYRRKRGATGTQEEGEGEGEGDTAKVAMSLKGAANFLSKELRGKSAADFEATTRGELQALLIDLVGLFGGVKSVGAIYSRDAAPAAKKTAA